MIIVQRFDAAGQIWVDEVVRHAWWNAYTTTKARCWVSGRSYRIVSGHSRDVLHEFPVDEYGNCCRLKDLKATKSQLQP
jgi:hypothetical protein